MVGIYYIKNTVNGKLYVGSSVDIKNRLTDHLSNLRNNKHCNIFLQRSWNKYEGKFETGILEEGSFTNEELAEKENYYINQLKTLDDKFGFNLCLVTEQRKNRVSEETKRKISKSISKDFYKSHQGLIAINKVTGEEMYFECLQDAGNYIVSNNISKSRCITKVKQSISQAANNKKIKINTGWVTRRSIYGFIWKFNKLLN